MTDTKFSAARLTVNGQPIQELRQVTIPDLSHTKWVHQRKDHRHFFYLAESRKHAELRNHTLTTYNNNELMSTHQNVDSPSKILTKLQDFDATPGCLGFDTQPFQEVLAQCAELSVDGAGKIYRNGQSIGCKTKGQLKSLKCVNSLKLVCPECEKLRKTLHNLKRVKIIPPMDDATVENIKLKNTIKTVLRENNQLKKDNAKLKKAIESNPLSKLQNRISHPNCCWENCEHTFPTIVALQEHVTIAHIVTQQQSNVTPHLKLYKCGWRGCKNTTGFKSKAAINTHIWDYHTGHRNDDERLTIIQDEIKNIGRAPPGRRWEATTVRASSNSFTTGSLEKARANGLTLPSKTTVNRHRQFGSKTTGWSQKVINEMNNALTDRGAPAHAKCGLLAFDEVKIKEGIVYDSNTGKLIGMCDANWKQIGTHILQFFYISAFHNFSWPVAYFITSGSGASLIELQTYFWQGVAELEANSFEVLGAIYDGAGTNRRFQTECLVPGSTCKGMNVCQPEKDLIFMSDPPHLHKKNRNCQARSGHKKPDEDVKKGEIVPTRLMIRNGQEILWSHVQEALGTHNTAGYKCTPLTKESVYLNDFSQQRVHLVDNVFHPRTIHKVQELGHTETARYMENCRRLWACLSSEKLVDNKDEDYINVSPLYLT